MSGYTWRSAMQGGIATVGGGPGQPAAAIGLGLDPTDRLCLSCPLDDCNSYDRDCLLRGTGRLADKTATRHPKRRAKR
ncbi:MAG: hypothetical protein AUJ55_11685 [Proteobacteria bacterium CG1_02_64_396]|nr:MAG: hypothetical protein AUJ55_11685 [Proteobacteria bacterium CG1_02_64_396]